MRFHTVLATAAAAVVIASALVHSAGNTERAEESPDGNPLGRDPAAIQSGDALFHERCAVCHGQRAQGAMASNLKRTRAVKRGSEEALLS